MLKRKIDTEQSKSVTGETRAAIFNDLLCFLLESEANSKLPLIIQLEDVHLYVLFDFL